MKQLTTSEFLQLLMVPASRIELVNSWPFTRCYLCKEKAATGIWMCGFASQRPPWIRNELKALCAGCGLTDAYRRWNGFMSPKLERIDLFVTISAPEGDKRTPADILLEKLLTHPMGEAYIRVWRGMYKPVNLHHPIQPAFLMLQALVEKLFPPQDNKVD